MSRVLNSITTCCFLLNPNRLYLPLPDKWTEYQQFEARHIRSVRSVSCAGRTRNAPARQLNSKQHKRAFLTGWSNCFSFVHRPLEHTNCIPSNCGLFRRNWEVERYVHVELKICIAHFFTKENSLPGYFRRWTVFILKNILFPSRRPNHTKRINVFLDRNGHYFKSYF